MRISLKWLAALLVALWAANGIAQDGGAPNLQEWSSQVKGLPKGAEVVQRLAFLQDLGVGAEPRFLSFDEPAFSHCGFRQSIDSSSMTWTLKLNETPWHKQRVSKSPEEQLGRVFKLTRADTVVYPVSDEAWGLARLEDGKPKLVLKAGAPMGKPDSQGLCQWLARTLGYDGVVLSRQGPFVLVEASPTLLTNNAQALALKDSDAELAIAKDERTGAALLQLVQADGVYGVFRILFADKSGSQAVPLGTKIIIDRAATKDQPSVNGADSP